MKNVAAHLSTKYKNFQVLQNDPDRLNGLDIAIGHFTGIDEDGEGVSLVVIGSRLRADAFSWPNLRSRRANCKLLLPRYLRCRRRSGSRDRQPSIRLRTPRRNTKPSSPPSRENGAAPGRVNITNRTRWVEIQDPAWGIVAARFQIPADWNFDGILIRDGSCGLAPTLAWRISRPTDLMARR